MLAAKAKEMKEIEEYTINTIGITGLVLMENAAREFTNILIKEQEKENNPIIIFCGTGNNGGDGFAIGRMLKQKDMDFKVVLIGDPSKLKNEALVNYNILLNMEINIIHIQSDLEFNKYIHSIPKNAIFVDAIFGIGCDRIIEGFYAKIISKINDLNKKVYAVDIPSGINSDNGSIMGIAINAFKTITFTLPKLGLYIYPGASFSGDVIVVDIGIPKKALINKPLYHKIIEKNFKELLPKRKANSHKGSFGKVLIISGSKNMMGAAILAAKAAYKSGCGIVKVLTEEGNESSIYSSIPEAIVETFKRKEKEFKEDINKIIDSIDWADAILIGPGMTDDTYTLKLLELVLKKKKGNIVIDADGLNVLSKNLFLLDNPNENIIITPHIGEMARLTGQDSNEIIVNTIEASKTFSKKYNIITVLKSARTVITCNEQVFINSLGNNGMATAGSGDVLSGIIVSMLAQTNNSLEAAVLGTFIHSSSGDNIKDLVGEYSLTANDIINGISSVMR